MAATCPRHPEAATSDLCVGCGEFVCAQCAFVSSDRRVFCPTCKERLPPEEQAGPAAPVPAGERPARRAAPLQQLSPLMVLPPTETPSVLAATFKHNPLALASIAFGLAALAWYPLAFMGLALGIQEMRNHINGSSRGHIALAGAGFAISAVAIMVRMAMWNGK